MKKQTLLGSVLLLSFAPLAWSAPANDPVVAEVNGVAIKKSEFDQNYRQNMLFVSSKKVTPEKVINDMVNRIIGIQRAKKNSLDKDELVKSRMEDVLYHAQISKDLEGKLQKITVSDKEAEQYYGNHKEYRTAHILFRLKVDPTPEEVDAAMTQALKIYKTLEKEPEKFPEMANKFSQASVAPNGGDLGYQPAAMYAPEYFSAINGKTVGHITKPVRTQFGLHIIKVMGIRDFKDVDPALYKKFVYDIKRDEILEAYFKDLRQGASIKINQSLIK